jgi:hypothetical protein
MSEKKFANLHYPGMRVDPNEGNQKFTAEVMWRFGEQIACIGEDAQRQLLSRSVFILSSNPVAFTLAQKLAALGIGRIGIFGEQPLSGAHGLPKQKEENAGALNSLRRYISEHAPWCEFETYSEESIDRQVSDMARGFQLVVSTGNAAEVKSALKAANDAGLPLAIGHVLGKKGWLAKLDAGALCEECLELPDFNESVGLYYPLVEAIALRLALIVIEDAPSGMLEVRDASQVPWTGEAMELISRAECEKCQAMKK